MTSLYLLKEAGALLAGASVAGFFSNTDASPRVRPSLPWSFANRNSPGRIPPVPIMTRIPAGSGRPPSAYDTGEAGLLNSETGWMGEAGSVVPTGSGFTQAQWDAMSPTMQQAVLNELHIRTTTATPPPPPAFHITSSTQAPTPAPSTGCPPGYINLGGGEFPNNCVPAHTIAPTPTPAPPIATPAPTPTPAPPIMLTRSTAPPNVAPPPSNIVAPPAGSGATSSDPVPWLIGGGVVLAFLYAGRRKKRATRR